MAHRRLTHPLSVTQTIIDNLARDGKQFSYDQVINFAGAQTKNFLLDLSDVPEEVLIVFSPIVGQAVAERVDAYIYEDTDYTGGSTVQFRNSNRNFSDTYNPVFTTGATGSVKGTELRHFIYPGDRAGENIRPNTGQGFVALIVNNSCNYLIEVTAAAATDFQVNINFFEERV